MGLTIYQVDAFTDRPFAGNPAAVCILPAPRDERWMQKVAGEMNLSETAFLVKRDDGYDLRWFTPAVEVDLCGHATLASAHILWETGQLQPDRTARFHTPSGLLTATRDGDLIELDFPALPAEPIGVPDELAEALGTQPLHAGRSKFDYLIELDSEKTLLALRPDFNALRATGSRGVIVTSRGEGSGYDCVSRFFAPGAGIDEDPVTGSAHCVIGPWWSEKLGKRELRAFQASARGGALRVRVAGERVRIAGNAVTVLEAVLRDV
jgi:PhzF family phenazine biosynthesis protein